MINKTYWDNVLDKAKNILENYSISQLSEKVNITKKELHNFDVKVLFVGHFSAGKSALLNGLLDRPGFLAEDQLPQTAVAAELHWNEQETMKLFLEDGTVQTCDIQTKLFPKNTSHVEYELNAEALKELSDFTLVDTPGFDSGIENHNRALAAYLGNGSCFVLVISLEKGVVDNPTLRFVHEISNYSDSLIVLLNKRDKLTDADAQEIQAAVEESLEFDGIQAKVYCVSKYDEDISNRLTEMINSFNVQRVFDKQAGKLVLIQLKEIRYVLETLLAQNRDISLFNYDKKLHQLQQTKKDIQEIFNRKKREAEEDFPEKTEEIKRNMKTALLNCADDVVNATMSGGAQAAEAVIVEAIRPLLLQSFRDYTIEHLDGIVSEMKNQISSSTDKDSETVSNLLVNATENIKKMVENGTFSRKVPGEEDVDKIKEEKENKFKKVYHVVTGVLAIATDLISPWLEIAVVLAPEIIRGVQKLFGESEAEKAKKIYINSTIPQILRQMDDSIRNAMKESHTLLMEALNQELEEKIAFVDSSIKETSQQKEETEQKHKEYKAMLERDIAELIKLENEAKGR